MEAALCCGYPLSNLSWANLTIFCHRLDHVERSRSHNYSPWRSPRYILRIEWVCIGRRRQPWKDAFADLYWSWGSRWALRCGFEYRQGSKCLVWLHHPRAWGQKYGSENGGRSFIGIPRTRQDGQLCLDGWRRMNQNMYGTPGTTYISDTAAKYPCRTDAETISSNCTPILSKEIHRRKQHRIAHQWTKDTVQ